MKKILLVLSFAMVGSCSSSSTQESTVNPQEVENTSTEWSIPVTEVLDGGPGRDGIPALENPVMVAADQSSILLDGDLVLGYKNGNDIRAYQHIVLDWHEIVNDKIGDVSLAVTYCPLTGTGIGWNRIVNGRETTFGVSGLLYQTNLIPFDRATKSNWSQLLNESVNGDNIGEKADLIPLVETDWKTWKTMFPETKLLSLNTGFSRTYGVYPYVDYKTNQDNFLFPVPKDSRLPLKERVFAIIDGEKAKVYRFSNFRATNVFKDAFEGGSYLMVGNTNFMVSFALTPAQEGLVFDYLFDGTSVAVVRDSDGNGYNIFGEVISGAGNNGPLRPADGFMGYWFSIPAFYETEIYSN
ncbi:DUF3179 domain-containing protein [Flavobacteriaceae bacterium TP-CH-4]|uniref:DUF3179 domain-containing protein n=1 Tax=Pelagihabitans pacificus TaxID=2696054 RepID=A0A967AX24_9FLAO|nr:DUF3179 domain-containing protein [Pelagihabitans pacificus]NHF61492.1 DUF3179 domain-containing protein [Pelagihabitans pacificus]